MEAVNRAKDPGLTQEKYHILLERTKDADQQILLRLTWALAGRMGDVRRLRPENIQIEEGPEGAKTIKATFVEGKKFTFWSVYTLVTCIPNQEAKMLQEKISRSQVGEHMWPKPKRPSPNQSRS